MSIPGRDLQNDLDEEVVAEMRSNDEAVSLEWIMAQSDIEDADTAKNVMRYLINDGKVSTTPEWNYKLASRLRR